MEKVVHKCVKINLKLLCKNNIHVKQSSYNSSLVPLP